MACKGPRNVSNETVRERNKLIKKMNKLLAKLASKCAVQVLNFTSQGI